MFAVLLCFFVSFNEVIFLIKKKKKRIGLRKLRISSMERNLWPNFLR